MNFLHKKSKNCFLYFMPSFLPFDKILHLSLFANPRGFVRIIRIIRFYVKCEETQCNNSVKLKI